MSVCDGDVLIVPCEHGELYEHCNREWDHDPMECDPSDWCPGGRLVRVEAQEVYPGESWVNRDGQPLYALVEVTL